MDMTTEKLMIIQRICETQDSELLDLIQSIIDLTAKGKFDWWKDISDQERESINRGLNDLEKGKVFLHDQVREKYEKYL
jgi:hypothetical protein